MADWWCLDHHAPPAIAAAGAMAMHIFELIEVLPGVIRAAADYLDAVTKPMPPAMY
jgi:hypothetical protein